MGIHGVSIDMEKEKRVRKDLGRGKWQEKRN